MKTTNKLFLFLCVSVCSLSYAHASDPFIQEWDYYDGVTTYKLSIRTSDAPGQNYAINYTLPNGMTGTSDPCTLTSSTSFQCVGGETVTRDDVNYRVQLHSLDGDFTFYDPKHMPTTENPIFGSWHYRVADSDGFVANHSMTISKGPHPNQYTVTPHYSDSNGGTCQIGSFVYEVKKNDDGTELISCDRHDWHTYYFKYDPYKKEISNPFPGQDFYPNPCSAVLAGSFADHFIYTK